MKPQSKKTQHHPPRLPQGDVRAPARGSQSQRTESPGARRHVVLRIPIPGQPKMSPTCRAQAVIPALLLRHQGLHQTCPRLSLQSHWQSQPYRAQTKCPAGATKTSLRSLMSLLPAPFHPRFRGQFKVHPHSCGHSRHVRSATFPTEGDWSPRRHSTLLRSDQKRQPRFRGASALEDAFYHFRSPVLGTFRIAPGDLMFRQ